MSLQFFCALWTRHFKGIPPCIDYFIYALSGEIVVDTFKLEEYLNPEEGESLKECIERKYGKKAREFIENFLS